MSTSAIGRLRPNIPQTEFVYSTGKYIEHSNCSAWSSSGCAACSGRRRGVHVPLDLDQHSQSPQYRLDLPLAEGRIPLKHVAISLGRVEDPSRSPDVPLFGVKVRWLHHLKSLSIVSSCRPTSSSTRCYLRRSPCPIEQRRLVRSACIDHRRIVFAGLARTST